MNDTVPEDEPFAKSVFYPADAPGHSATAFSHALAFALGQRSDFTITRAVADHAAEGWSRFPPVRETLVEWGHLGKGSGRSAVFQELGIRVRKIKVVGADPLGAALEYFERRPADLLVLGTDRTDDPIDRAHRARAERIAQALQAMTLLVGASVRGFVSPEDGRMRLARILVPVDSAPDSRQAAVMAAKVAVQCGGEGTEIALMHVGSDDAMPPLEPLKTASSTWVTARREGDPAKEIVHFADEHGVDLVVMATAGHHGVLDAFRGSVTAFVVRRAPCPVLAVPAGSPRLC